MVSSVLRGVILLPIFTVYVHSIYTHTPAIAHHSNYNRFEWTASYVSVDCCGHTLLLVVALVPLVVVLLYYVPIVVLVFMAIRVQAKVALQVSCIVVVALGISGDSSIASGATTNTTTTRTTSLL